MSQQLLQGKELTAKIREYEKFANDVLKVDLQKTTELRAKYQLEIQELEELRRNIEQLQKVCIRLYTESAMLGKAPDVPSSQ